MNFLTETVHKVLFSQNEMKNELRQISAKVDKICNKIFQNPDYYSVGEIALKQGISQKQFEGILKKGIFLTKETRAKNHIGYQVQNTINHYLIMGILVGFRITQESNKTILV